MPDNSDYERAYQAWLESMEALGQTQRVYQYAPSDSMRYYYSGTETGRIQSQDLSFPQSTPQEIAPKIEENKPKRIRWRQKWYNVRCACEGDFSHDVIESQKRGIRYEKIFKVACHKCGNYHWIYDTPADDKIYLHNVGGYYIKLKKEATKFENFDVNPSFER